MNHRKQLSALLAAALTLSVCAGGVIATQTAADTPAPPQEQLLISPAPAPQTVKNTTQTENTSDADSQSQTPTPIPDPEGTVSFSNVAQRVRENNLTARALGSSITAIEAMDYEEMSEDLRKTLNQLADGVFAMYSMPMGMGAASAASLQATYSSLREQFDAIKEGEMQQDNADTIHMLKNTQNQLAMAAESLYITLIELQQNQATLDRNLNTLDRGLAELDIRYEMGQVSSMTVQETKAARTSLLSARQTLLSNYQILIYQLQSLLGEELTGELTLASLPAVTGEQLSAMNFEADLEQAKQVSYTLVEAQNKLDDAIDTYKDDSNMYKGDPTSGFEYEMAYHQLEAAHRTYEASVQSFELGLRTLYLQIQDYQQVLETAKSTLAIKQNSYAAVQVKYEQGVLSEFDLLDAQDTVSEAQDAVNSAAIKLFSAYTNYRWAVDYGILN